MDSRSHHFSFVQNKNHLACQSITCVYFTFFSVTISYRFAACHRSAFLFSRSLLHLIPVWIFTSILFEPSLIWVILCIKQQIISTHKRNDRISSLFFSDNVCLFVFFFDETWNFKITKVNKFCVAKVQNHSRAGMQCESRALKMQLLLNAIDKKKQKHQPHTEPKPCNNNKIFLFSVDCIRSSMHSIRSFYLSILFAVAFVTHSQSIRHNFACMRCFAFLKHVF